MPCVYSHYTAAIPGRIIIFVRLVEVANVSFNSLIKKSYLASLAPRNIKNLYQAHLEHLP